MHSTSSTSPKGFTLAELLVAMTILVFIGSMSVISFTQIIRSQQAINARQRLQEDSRFILEKIVKEFRNGTLDYAQYHSDHWSTTYAEYQSISPNSGHPHSIQDGTVSMGSGIPNTETILNLINPDGTEQTKIQRNDTTDVVEIQKLTSCLDGGGDIAWDATPAYEDGSGNDIYLPLTAEGTTVSTLDFYISPTKDPNKVYEESAVQYQPMVMIRMTTETLDATGNTLTLDTQTTVSSRQFTEATWDDTITNPC